MQIKKIISYLKKKILLKSTKKQNIPVQPIYRYYQSIDSLPFENYANIVGGFEYVFDENKKVIVTKEGDYRYLIILDRYDELPEIKISPVYWQNITMQCFDFNHDQKSKNYIDARSYLLRLGNEYNQIVDSCLALSYPVYLDDESRKTLIEIVEKYVNINKPFKFDYYSNISRQIIKSKSKHYKIRKFTNLILGLLQINYRLRTEFNEYKFIDLSTGLFTQIDNKYFESICIADNYAKKDLIQKITLKVHEFETKNGKKDIDKSDLWPKFYEIQRYFKYENLNPKTYTTKRFLVDNQAMNNELSKK